MVKFTEFEAHLQEEVKNFLREYLESHQEIPEEYPLEFESMADWWEQFDLTVQRNR